LRSIVGRSVSRAPASMNPPIDIPTATRLAARSVASLPEDAQVNQGLQEVCLRVVSDKLKVETERVPTEEMIMTGATSNLVNLAQGDPWQTNLSIQSSANQYENLWFTIPQGMTLALTSASVRMRVPSGQHVVAMLGVNGPAGLVMGFDYFVMVHQGTFNATDIYTGTHSTLLWVGDNGGFFQVQRSDTFAAMEVEVSAAGVFVA
jgi:hypothetical protein